MRGNFNFRAWTSLILVWTFVLLIISGTVLFVSPAGRISNWTDWRMATLTKAQWQSVHTLAAVAFLTGGLFHLLKFNWKVFRAYATKKGDSGWRYGRELAASIVLVAAVATGTIVGIPPFSSLMAAGETIKNSWSTAESEPPVPHLELLTMRQLSERLRIEPAALSSHLNRKGLTLTGVDQSLADVAKRNNLSPREVYGVAQAAGGSSPNPVAVTAAAIGNHAQPGFGGGPGFRTLSQIAVELGLTPEEALARLRARKIEAELQETIRTIASRSNMKPYELVELLKESNM
jgi:hypothetical protein